MDQIGSLDQLVTLQAASETSDGGGGKEQVWADFATDATVWAEVYPMGGNETDSDGSVNARGMWRFVIRNRSDVSELDRIVWDGAAYNIRRVARRGGRELYLTIEAERGVAQ